MSLSILIVQSISCLPNSSSSLNRRFIFGGDAWSLWQCRTTTMTMTMTRMNMRTVPCCSAWRWGAAGVWLMVRHHTGWIWTHCCNLYKFISQFIQIHLAIHSSTFSNLDKHIFELWGLIDDQASHWLNRKTSLSVKLRDWLSEDSAFPNL